MDPFVLNVLDIKQGKFKKILTCSPRKRSLNNGSYLDSGYTDLIDCFARDEHLEYGFHGFADYAGLKDDLPKSGGSGKGAALVMLYNHHNNKFYTITHRDTDFGVRGYKYVIEEMFSPSVKKELEEDDCLAYAFVQNKMINQNKNGNWAQWNYITILRTLSEMKKVYK